jgi:hypothetical protein
VRTAGFKNLLQVVFGWSGAPLEITLAAALNSSLEFSISFPMLLWFIIMVRRYGRHFCPIFPPLAPFLVPLTVKLGGVVQPPPAAAPTSAKVKTAPMASSPEACRVVMSSYSLAIFGC